MQCILLIDDHVETQLIVKNVVFPKYRLISASSASDALKKIENFPFDLILIDISLPDGNGLEFCTQLKNNSKTRNTPFIFLTADGNTHSKVIGFSLGAQDYVVKPFDPVELRARIEARLQNIQENKEREEVINVENLIINTVSQKVLLTKGDEEIDLKLTPLEFKILLYFVKNEKIVLNREQIITAVWGWNADIFDRVIDKHLSTLRHKLKDSSQIIETVHGLGYYFNPSSKKIKP